MKHDEKIQALAHFLQTPEGEESLINLLTSTAELVDFEVSALLGTMVRI